MNPWASVAKYATICLAVFLVLWAAYHRGVVAEHERGVAEIAILQRDAAQKVAASEATARNIEQRAAQDGAAIARQNREGIEHANHERDAAVSDLRAGKRRLRFQCPAGDSADLAAVAAGTGRRDGEAQAGLSADAAEFLIREAGRADEVVVQLSACQALVDADRAAINGTVHAQQTP